MDISRPSKSRNPFLCTDSDLPTNAKNFIKEKDFSFVFMKHETLLSDINMGKLPLEALHETFNRILNLLDKSSVVARLPDQGFQLRQVKERLQKEIQFRERLNQTQAKMAEHSIKCASDTDMESAHNVRLYSLERKEPMRFRPNLVRHIPSSRTESTTKIGPVGIQLIDLPDSIRLQKEHAQRAKAEQMALKQRQLREQIIISTPSATSSDSEQSEQSEVEEGHCDEQECELEELDILHSVEDSEKLQKMVNQYIMIDTLKQDGEGAAGPSGIQPKLKSLKREEDCGGSHGAVGGNGNDDCADLPNEDRASLSR